MAKEYLELYSDNCLQCSHLIEGAPKTFNKCHYTAGNKDCPASEIRIITTGRVRRAAALIKQARADKDPEREAEILQKVSSESPGFLHLLYELIG